MMGGNNYVASRAWRGSWICVDGGMDGAFLIFGCVFSFSDVLLESFGSIYELVFS